MYYNYDSGICQQTQLAQMKGKYSKSEEKRLVPFPSEQFECNTADWIMFEITQTPQVILNRSSGSLSCMQQIRLIPVMLKRVMFASNMHTLQIILAVVIMPKTPINNLTWH